MRRFVIVLTLGGAPYALPGDRWTGPDKVKHFFTSAFVQSMSYGSLRAIGASHGAALVAATGATTAVSVGKEAHDARVKGEFSARDLAWDALGAGAATVLLSRVAR